MIVEYLQGTLNEEKIKEVEERASGDLEFRRLIQLHREVDESIQDKDLHLFHQMIRKAGDNYFKESGRGRFKSLTLFRIAAAFLIVAAAGFILKYALHTTPNAEKLYRQYYAVYETDVISRSTAVENGDLNIAVLHYSQKEYAEALMTLDAIIKQDQHNNLAWFYRGLTCMEMNASGEAIYSFLSIPSDWDSAFSEHREWYLALSYLQEGKLKEAETTLQQIADSKGYYAVNAEKLLRKLNS
jgi:tetratricopeptide (TPR) repeat protein